MNNNEKARVEKHIRILNKKGALKDKKIVLFGASIFSKTILMYLIEHGYKADAVVDNDSRKIGKQCLGMRVKSPEEELTPFNNNTVILLYSVGFYREMTIQLEQMGYKKKQHIIAMNYKPDDSLKYFSVKVLLRLQGIYHYKRILRGHSKNCTVFIAPYTGTGDIYLVGLFFDEYVRQNDIKEYVFIVVSNACKKVAGMFGIKNISVLPGQIGDEIISLEKSTGRDLNITVLNDGWLDDPLQWLRGYKGLHFEEVFRRFVFGFDGSVRHTLPERKDYANEIDGIFSRNGLQKGKTVVLSPYSNTMFDLPDDMLREIVNHCKEKGYAVCTNCAGTEKPVAGTQPVFFPLDMAIDFMDAAGFFIGVRSGLCDIISSSGCKKIIFYEKEGLFYKSSQLEYFSLKKMGLCDDAIELEYADYVKDSLLERVYKELGR